MLSFVIRLEVELQLLFRPGRDVFSLALIEGW